MKMPKAVCETIWKACPGLSGRLRGRKLHRSPCRKPGTIRLPSPKSESGSSFRAGARGQQNADFFDQVIQGVRLLQEFNPIARGVIVEESFAAVTGGEQDRQPGVHSL